MARGSLLKTLNALEQLASADKASFASVPASSGGHQDSVTGSQIVPDKSGWIYARVHAIDSDAAIALTQCATPHSWEQVAPQRGGCWGVPITGISGTADNNPAFEINSREFEGASIVIKLWPGARFVDDDGIEQLEWLYDAECCDEVITPLCNFPCCPAFSEIAFDAASDSGYKFAQTTFSWTHTCNNFQRVLIVGISIQSAHSVSGITYAGVAMTRILTRTHTSTTTLEMWRLVAPATSSNSIAVTMSGAANCIGGACSFSGVDPSGTIVASASNDGEWPTQPSVSVVPGTVGAWLVDALATDELAVIGPGPDQVERVDTAGAIHLPVPLGSIGMSTLVPILPVTVASTMTWQGIGPPHVWAQGVASLKPYLAPTPCNICICVTGCSFSGFGGGPHCPSFTLPESPICFITSRPTLRPDNPAPTVVSLSGGIRYGILRHDLPIDPTPDTFGIQYSLIGYQESSIPLHTCDQGLTWNITFSPPVLGCDCFTGVTDTITGIPCDLSTLIGSHSATTTLDCGGGVSVVATINYSVSLAVETCDGEQPACCPGISVSKWLTAIVTLPGGTSTAPLKASGGRWDVLNTLYSMSGHVSCTLGVWHATLASNPAGDWTFDADLVGACDPFTFQGNDGGVTLYLRPA